VNRRVVFRPQAEVEALEARDWYERCRRGLGTEFGAEMERVVRAITAEPASFARVHRDMRRAILRRFPYAVYFRVIRDEIVVLAVMHGRRHPRLWKRRR